MQSTTLQFEEIATLLVSHSIRGQLRIPRHSSQPCLTRRKSVDLRKPETIPICRARRSDDALGKSRLQRTSFTDPLDQSYVTVPAMCACADRQTPIDQVNTRPPSAREKKRPAIQLGVVKLETPTPEPEPELPLAPSKSARRRKRHAGGDEDEESDDGGFTDQWFLA
jgi:hypothetical protein